MSFSGSGKYRLSIAQLKSIFDTLVNKGFRNIGSIAKDGAIMLEEIGSFSEMARGCYEQQGKGNYQLDLRDDNALFGYTVGPQSYKKYLHPPRRKIWSASGSKKSFTIENPEPPPKMAFWGVRNCDLAAIRILDRIFLQGSVVNKWYQSARKELFIVAAGCSTPSSNCFCTTMVGGPSPEEGFDICLWESSSDSNHYFLAEFRSKRAKEILEREKYSKASNKEIDEIANLNIRATGRMRPRFDTKRVSGMIKENLEHKHWEDIANRCLSCANCNMVCPTCFCTTTEDITDITGDHTERWIRWDSCFNGHFSYLHGGPVRTKTRSCYRQWMSHKFSNWYDQFGSAGCVGCGRCIAWCPVGIDVSEEIVKMQEAVAQGS